MFNSAKNNYFHRALLCAFLLSTSAAFSQGKVVQILKAKMSQKLTSEFPLLEKSNVNVLENKSFQDIGESIKQNAKYYEINPSAAYQIRKNNQELIRVSVDVPGYGLQELGLYRQSIFSSDLLVHNSENKKISEDIRKAMFYRGMVLGKESSLVTLTIFNDEVSGVISIGTDKFNLGKIKDTNLHILYNEKDLNRIDDFVCGVLDPELDNVKPMEESDFEKTINCVRLRVEVDNELNSQLGGISASNEYVAGLFNQVVTLYANDEINVVVSEIFVWSGSSPYSGSANTILNQMDNDSPNADLTSLLSTQSSGGVAWGSGLCSSNFGVNFNSVDGVYNNLPSYSWDVNVVAHEIGHNLSSPHTHACLWNGNNTPIDGCGANAGYSEGCSGDNPAEGGTIMSYCHLTGVGVNFSLGFGAQPSQRIKFYVENSFCLGTSCGDSEPTCNDGIQNGNETGIDCGGGCEACPSCDDGIQNGNETAIDCGGSCEVCPTCDDGIQNGSETDVDCGGLDCELCDCVGQQIFLNITFDEFAGETYWLIKNEDNAIIEFGSNYGNQSNGSSINIPICLPNGCFTFVIFDSSNNGMCCSNGNGSYILTTADGLTLSSGGSFGASEGADFCVGQDTVNCANGVPVLFALQLDGKPEETKWEIFSEEGYVAAQGYNYDGQFNEMVVQELCLVDDCYRFAISDADGDGLCCEFGSGSYLLQNLQDNGMIMIGDGDIGTEEVVYFCLDGSSIQPEEFEVKILPLNLDQRKSIESNLSKGLTIFPNPTNSYIELKLYKDLSGNSSIIIYDISGSIVHRTEIQYEWSNFNIVSLNIGNLPSGIYTVVVENNNQKLQSKLVKIQ